MNYEIKIISEEDTIKSRTYEDLSKAIEIADKMLNEFVNTDFGDEIVVVDNLQNKTYWANGKIIYRPLRIGDKVKVKNGGLCYSTYTDFMINNGTKELCCDWNRGVGLKSYDVDNKTYTIKALGTHDDNHTQLAIIKDNTALNLSVYIIGTDGLELIY